MCANGPSRPVARAISLFSALSKAVAAPIARRCVTSLFYRRACDG
jgi:hypothetical protein